jgi:hypothetical protein
VPSYVDATKFMPLEGIDSAKHSTKYLDHQNNYLKGLYGSSLEDVNSINSFKKEVSLLCNLHCISANIIYTLD